MCLGDTDDTAVPIDVSIIMVDIATGGSQETDGQGDGDGRLHRMKGIERRWMERLKKD